MSIQLLRFMYCVVILFAAVVAVCSALSSPLTGTAAERLYGDDCSQWCFNGTDILQPEVFGTSNTYCPDSRGCEWKWRLSFAPCSLSLLDFDALVGPDGKPYSDIDPAGAASLQFYCSQSDGGVVLELRPHAAGPIMTWHYRDVTCVELLGDFASRQAEFTSHEVGISLDRSDWFATGATRLEDQEVDCATHKLLHDDLEPCEQCFRGLEEPTLPTSGWSDVCGANANSCQVDWHFCYDVCTGKTRRAGIDVGSASLKQVTGVGALAVQCSQTRGRTVLALTDASSIDALDGGQASVFVAWEYRDAECEALMRSPRRYALFVKRHFAVERGAHTLDDGTEVQASMMALSNILTGGLDERTWIGAEQSVSSESSSDLSGTEVGLIVGFAITAALCLLGWLLVVILWRRGTSPEEGMSFRSLVPMPVNNEVTVPSASMWGDKTPLANDAEGDDLSADTRRQELTSAIQKLDEEAENDKSYLYTDRAEVRATQEDRAVKKEAAQRELDQIDGKAV